MSCKKKCSYDRPTDSCTTCGRTMDEIREAYAKLAESKKKNQK